MTFPIKQKYQSILKLGLLYNHDMQLWFSCRIQLNDFQHFEITSPALHWHFSPELRNYLATIV